MKNWLQEYLGLYPEAMERRTSRPYDLGAVEDSVAGSRTSGLIGPEMLKAIEQHRAWDYPWWWPRLSEVWKDSLALPPPKVAV